MALADKKHTRFYSTSGTDADKVSDSKLLEVKAIWEADVANGNNLDLLSHPDLGPLIYQMQQMQDELDEIRRHVKDDVVGQQGPKGDKGDTGARGATGATGATGPAGADGVVDESKIDMSKVNVARIDLSKLDASTLPTSKPKNKNLLWSNKGVVSVS